MYDIERPSARQIATGTRWLIGGAALAIVVALVIGGMAVFGVGWFQRSTADFRGETAALEQIKANADNRISAYEYFFDLCASIQGHEDTIRNLRTELDGDPSEKRREQIHGAITVNQSQRDGKIRQYNSEASKDYTAAQFKDADLPDRLDINTKETTCASES